MTPHAKIVVFYILSMVPQMWPLQPAALAGRALEDWFSIHSCNLILPHCLSHPNIASGGFLAPGHCFPWALSILTIDLLDYPSPKPLEPLPDGVVTGGQLVKWQSWYLPLHNLGPANIPPGLFSFTLFKEETEFVFENNSHALWNNFSLVLPQGLCQTRLNFLRMPSHNVLPINQQPQVLSWWSFFCLQP